MSREQILKNIRNNKPDQTALEAVSTRNFFSDRNLLETFTASVLSVGGSIENVSDTKEVIGRLRLKFPDAKKIISLVAGVEISTIQKGEITSAADLDTLDLAVIQGDFGVAENGAVWCPEKNFYHRSIPFITSHLVIVVDKKNLVETMHDAVVRIANFLDGYGVFISGPSKTADIEQSLVMGAQGALSLTVFVL